MRLATLEPGLLAARRRGSAGEHVVDAQLRLLAELIPQMVWVARADGACEYVNGRYCEYAGTTEEEALSRGWEALLHPDDAELCAGLWSAAVASGGAFEAEYRVRRSDGSYRWILGRAEPLRDEGGRVLRWIGTATEVHERKLAREALAAGNEMDGATSGLMGDESGERPSMIRITRDALGLQQAEEALHGPRLIAIARDTERRLEESEERSWRAVMASPFPTMIHADDGQVISINDAWTKKSGYTLDQIPTLAAWLERAYGDRKDAMARAVESAYEHLYAADGATTDSEYTLMTADGQARTWAFSSASLGRDAQGRRVVISVAHDVTERNQAIDALKEADQRKDEFMAMLAHELRNPLGPVRNAVRILGLVGDEQPRVVQARAIIERQVSHMARLLDDMLDVSRVACGKIALVKDRCDLRQLVAQTAEDHRSTLEAGGIELELSMPSEPVWVMGDSTRLSQVVTNVLHNANKFTNPGGRVMVSLAEAAGGWAEVRIRDTGIGIEASMLERVFEPFSQADRGLERNRGGLGLGLALVKGFVELHGGAVSAASAGPGEGAEVILRLPLLEGAERVEEPVAAVSANPRALRVLIIEDNADAAESTQTLLELSGHEAAIAMSGSAGLEAARSFHPDVVLCDIGLPGGMDGYAVARALREIPAPERRPELLIALTGYGQEEHQRRAREAGFDVHLVKPVDWSTLEEVLASFASRA